MKNLLRTPAVLGAAFCAALVPLAGLALASAADAETIAYGYDARGRLVVVTRTNAAGSTTTQYGHDRADNRTLKTTTTP